MRNKQDAQFAFTPQKLTPSGQSALLRVEVAYRELAMEVCDLAPEGADRTAALRKLLDSKMTCVQAISHEKPVQASVEETKEKGHHADKKKSS